MRIHDAEGLLVIDSVDKSVTRHLNDKIQKSGFQACIPGFFRVPPGYVPIIEFLYKYEWK